MPIPDTQGVPPFAEFEDLKRKINEIVQKYNNLLVNLDSLNVVSLTADHIDTGTLDAALVTIKSLLNAGAYIQIDGTGMKIFDGTKNTFIADITGLVTMTGALIQSAAGFPKVTINSANNLVGAYADSDTYVAFIPVFNSVPAFVLVDNGTTKGFINRGSAAAGTTLGTFDTEPLNLQASGPLQIGGVNGYNGSITYVKNVVSGAAQFGTINVTKGIITSVS